METGRVGMGDGVGIRATSSLSKRLRRKKLDKPKQYSKEVAAMTRPTASQVILSLKGRRSYQRSRDLNFSLKNHNEAKVSRMASRRASRYLSSSKSSQAFSPASIPL